MGRSDDPYLLAGESGYDERKVVPAGRLEGDVVALSVAATMKLGLHFWAGDYAGAVDVADEALEHISGMDGNVIMQLVHMTSALSKVHVAPKAHSTRRSVRKALALHRKWAEGAPANYAAPYALIEGTWARARGQHRKAERYLDQAMALAEEHQLPLIAAAAYEEAATLYAETGRSKLRQHMLRAAYQRFLSLGMTLRTDRLAREHPWLISRDLVPAGSGIDPAEAHHVFRALSAARTPEGLAKIVLPTVADTTLAGRVLLLTGEGEQLIVRVPPHEGGRTTTVDGPWTAEVAYDRAIIRHVVDQRLPPHRRNRFRRRRHRCRQAGPARRDDPGHLRVPIRVQDKTIGSIYAE